MFNYAYSDIGYCQIIYKDDSIKKQVIFLEEGNKFVPHTSNWEDDYNEPISSFPIDKIINKMSLIPNPCNEMEEAFNKYIKEMKQIHNDELI